MYELIYISTAVRGLALQELMALLKEARQCNKMIGVTGMLLYDNREFIQILEGRKSIVLYLYDKIAQDPRHCSARILHQAEIGERAFGDWSMAFKEVDQVDLAEIQGFKRLDQRESFSFMAPGSENIGKDLFMSLHAGL